MERFNKLLVVLCVTFNRDFDTLLCEAYGQALKDYNEDDLLRVGKKMLAGRFFPRPYDFIQAIEGPKIELPDLATLRWAEIVAWLWTNSNFPADPIAKKIIEGLGDRFMFRNCTKAELDAHGWTFRRAYAGAVALQEKTAAESMLIESEEVKQIASDLSHRVAMEGRDDG